MFDFFKSIIKRSFDISVIIPIFNSEEYLVEAIESVVTQDIGFKDHIELILVNDGSTDKSEDICLNYRKEYPHNIRYIYKKNGGVSSALNAGLLHIKGKYVIFLGSDDKWQQGSFRAMYDFFELHNEEIDCLSAKVKIFGDREYEHSMNFKYSGNEVIEIDDHPDYLVTLAGNMMFRSSALQDIRFDETVSLGEDTLFDSEVLKSKKRYGQVSDAVLMYRKHENGALTNDRYHNKVWYLDYPVNVLLKIADMFRTENGGISEYAQQMIAYWIRFAVIDHGIHTVLSDEEYKQFDSIFNQLLMMLDNKVISSLKNTPLLTRNHLLEMKNGENVYDNAIIDRKGRLRYKKQIIFNPAGSGLVSLDSLKEEKDHVVVEGTTMICRSEGHCDLFAYSSEYPDKLINVKPYEDDYVRYMYNGMIANKREKFRVSIPARSSGSICFITMYQNNSIRYSPGVNSTNGTKYTL